MKKVFSSLLLIFILPLRQFKKIFKDNFLSGLILGAIFSLVVNVISMQVQGKVEKQRILEAIENEIYQNNVLANDNVTQAINQRKNKINASSYTIARKFSRDIWEQSVEPLEYVAQLKSNMQIEINAYYNIAIPASNQLIETLNSEYIGNMKNCFDDYIKKTEEEQNLCNDKQYFYLDSVALYPSRLVYDQAIKILEIFHPTQDRLNSPILRFLMGSESMRVLSGK